MRIDFVSSVWGFCRRCYFGLRTLSRRVTSRSGWRISQPLPITIDGIRYRGRNGGEHPFSLLGFLPGSFNRDLLQAKRF